MGKQIFNLKAVAVLSTVALSTMCTSAFATTINNSQLSGGLTVKASNSTLSLQGATTVDGITVDSTAGGSTITASDNASVTGSVQLNAPVTIGGSNTNAFNSASVAINTSQVTANIPLSNVKINQNTAIGGTSAQQVIDNAAPTAYTVTRNGSNAPSTTSITVNTTTTVDTVVVTGLSTGDTINVYAAATGGTPIGTGTAGSNGTANVVLTGVLANSGLVYVSRTEVGKTESARTAVPYGQVPTGSLLAPPLSIVVGQGSTEDTITLAANNVASGDTLAVKVGTSEPLVPNAGDSVPGDASAYTSGDIQAVANEWLAVYEVDGNGKVIKFYKKQLTATDFVLPAPLLSVVVGQGSTPDTITLTANNVTSGDTLAVKVGTSGPLVPNAGDSVPTDANVYTSGDIQAVINDWLAVYEGDANGKVVRFNKTQLTSLPAPMLSVVVGQGSTADTITLTANNVASGDTLAVKVGTSEPLVPNAGDSVPGDANSYTSGDIQAVANEWLAVYEVDGNGKVIRFYKKQL